MEREEDCGYGWEEEWGSQGTLGSRNHNQNTVYEKNLFSIKENKSQHHRRTEQNGILCAV